MTCKYLKDEIFKLPPERGSMFAETTRIPRCMLGRVPDVDNWMGKCKETPKPGPCWYWQSKNPDQLDNEFRSYP